MAPQVGKNHYLLKPFFGIPNHNSKTLQILYPLVSLILIAYSLSIMPETYQLKKFISSTFSFLQKMPTTLQFIGKLLMLSSPFIMSILCIVSFVRLVCIYKVEKQEDGKNKYIHQNWTNKLEYSSYYSKINDGLYWLGAIGAVLSLGFIIYNMITNFKIDNFKISGELLSADKVIIFVSAIILSLAVLMSIISTFAPCLTQPKSFIQKVTDIDMEPIKGNISQNDDKNATTTPTL